MFSMFHCGFHEEFNAQNCQLLIIKKWCEVLDNGGETGEVLTDPIKAFGCINHNLIIAKLNAYNV